MTSNEPPQTLIAQAQDFAARVNELLQSVLEIPAGEYAVGAVADGDPTGRVVIGVVDRDGRSARLPLFVAKEQVGELSVSYHATLDSQERFLRVVRADFSLKSIFERAPLVRLEFQVDSHSAPVAHWQFHGERGAFSHWLALAHAEGRKITEKPYSLSTLHFPVGGARFRPCLEDFLEFVVSECGVDHRQGWRKAVRDGREIWRRFQARAVARDFQAETAEVLKELGWKVSPPGGFVDSSDEDHKYGW